MAAFYPLFKQLHVILALISLSLFVYRWRLSFKAAPPVQPRWLTISPHLCNSLLFAGGIAMLAMHSRLLHQPWLITKLIVVLLYIGLGIMAFKSTERGQKLGKGLLALALFGYMYGASVTGSVWSWLG